jgi:hypothetical protein
VSPTIASNPSIEYWFLLHFEDTNKVFIASELKKYLKKYIPDYSTDENFLEKEDWVKNMSDNISIVCERAEKYTNENMSFTSFPLLISELKPK